MCSHESANDIYSHLSAHIDEVNWIGVTQLSQFNVVGKILSVLPIDMYGHIVIVLHQVNFSTYTQT